ncbi:MAG: terminase [Alphaproteobacteria bacterium]|nr:terminase [Alphaproteobacteria bacterium]
MILCEHFTSRELTDTDIAGLADAQSCIRKAFSIGLKPPPPIDFTRWAQENISFGKESQFEGPYNPDFFPFFREVLECLQPDHPAREVVLKKSAQLGGTIAAQVFLGASLDLDPGPFLYVHPTIDNGKRWARTKWKPFVKQSAALRRIMPGDNSRNKANTILFKERVDERGHILISGANSPSSLSMISYPKHVHDDLSKWEGDDKAGDPESLADSRAEGFRYAKIFKVSTPLVKGICRISKRYEESDQRVFLVPCPHCGFDHELTWENFQQSIRPDDEDWDVSKVHFTCPDCGGVIEHHHKTDMVARGYWKAQNPKAEIPGFFIWSAYSPLTDWARIARKWLKAKGDPKSEQVFFNDSLGLAYELKGDAPPWESLRDRAIGSYARGTIPPGGIIVTCGVDCQGDRVEYHVKAFGPNLQRFTIDYGVFDGHISEQRTRDSLDGLLKRSWINAYGQRIAIDMLAIDANYDTDQVLDWARRHPESRVIAIRGARGEFAPPLVAVKYDRRKGVKVKRRQKRFFNVGVSAMKASLYRQLEKTDVTDRGFCGYPDGLDDEFFKQLCSEKRVQKKQRNGYIVVEWQKLPDTRNEVLDTEIYAEAAAYRLGYKEFSTDRWAELAADRDREPAAVQPDLLDPNMAKSKPAAPLTPVEMADTGTDDDPPPPAPLPAKPAGPKRSLAEMLP